MPSRRQFLLTCLLLSAGMPDALAQEIFQGEAVLQQILARAGRGNWQSLKIGQLMGLIARQLQNTPYQANTLEISPDGEICSVNLNRLDCITFFETTLALARMIKKAAFGKSENSPAALLKEVQLLRYSGGKCGDYTSRLHYTSAWLLDNQKKGTISILNNLPGMISFDKNIDFMSSHAASYKQLQAHPELISKIKNQEAALNKEALKYLPLEKIAAAEHLLQTGDIVALCSKVPGLDISHTGLIIREGLTHFMDASSRPSVMKVTIEPGSISQYLQRPGSRLISGAIFARPLEPQPEN